MHTRDKGLNGRNILRLLSSEKWRLDRGHEGLGETFQRFLDAMAPAGLKSGMITLQKIISGVQILYLLEIHARLLGRGRSGVDEVFEAFVDAMTPEEMLETDAVPEYIPDTKLT